MKYCYHVRVQFEDGYAIEQDRRSLLDCYRAIKDFTNRRVAFAKYHGLEYITIKPNIKITWDMVSKYISFNQEGKLYEKITDLLYREFGKRKIMGLLTFEDRQTIDQYHQGI